MQGHLFDKQIFNRILDMFESRGINFRIVAWNFGQTVNDRTKVVMQGLSINEEELYNVEKEIMTFC